MNVIGMPLHSWCTTPMVQLQPALQFNSRRAHASTIELTNQINFLMETHCSWTQQLSSTFSYPTTLCPRNRTTTHRLTPLPSPRCPQSDANANARVALFSTIGLPPDLYKPIPSPSLFLETLHARTLPPTFPRFHNDTLWHLGSVDAFC